jgi:hypothetical protein
MNDLEAFARARSRPSQARPCQNPGVDRASEQGVAFVETRIGVGLAPLVQHGTAIVGVSLASNALMMRVLPVGK